MRNSTESSSNEQTYVTFSCYDGFHGTLDSAQTHSHTALKQEKKMKCQRCGGIMVTEEFYGPDNMFSGWRCIFCGEIIDPVILHNRRIQRRRAMPSVVRRHHFDILSVSDVSATGMPE